MTVSKTTNGGSTWTRYYLNSAGFTHALAVDPQNSNTVYAGGNPGIYKTTNGGATWSESSTGLSGHVSALVIHPHFTNIVFAGTSDGVFKSVNAGASWTYTGLDDVRSLAIDFTTPDTVFAGTNTGVFISQDQAMNWSVMNDGLEDTVITCLGLLHGQFLYTSTVQSGMYRFLLGPGIEENRTTAVSSRLSVFPSHARTHFTFTYYLQRTNPVSLCIFDVQGRHIKTVLAAQRGPGVHKTTWKATSENGIPLPAGVYFCQLETAEQSYVQKFVIVK